MVVRVGVLGAGGRMGQEVCRAVCDAEGLELAAAVDPSHEGVWLDELTGGLAPRSRVLGEIAAVPESAVDVMVDFTNAEAARKNLQWCAVHGVHAVVGTSGLSEADVERLRLSFADGKANVIVVPNFAIGAVLLMRFCELAAPYMDGVEIVELHHDGKRDAPSGTAIRTADRIGSARRAAGGEPFSGDPTETATISGSRGAEGSDGIRIHSIRLPGLVAHQEVIFGARGETLALRHDSLDRKSFMAGVLLAIRKVGERPGVTIGLDQLFNL